MNDPDNTHNVALFGITGALGREIEAALEVEHEGIADLFPVAGIRSAGMTVRWRGANLTVRGPGELKPADVDFAIFATPPEVVSREAGRLLDAGARVLDASGVLASPPLPKALTRPAPMAWPNLSTFSSIDLGAETVLVLPSSGASTLAPLLDALTLPAAGLPKLESVAATILLPASHAGREGIEALSRQTVGTLNYQPALEPRPFPAVLAFNAVLPPPETVVLFEAKTVSELRRLVPALGATSTGGVSIELTPIWIAAFSGIVASLHLRFAADVPPEALARVFAAHPDLARDESRGDDEDDDETEDGDEPAVSPDEPDALSLRASLDGEHIRVGTPLFAPKSVRLVAMGDPIARTAQAASVLLTRWIAALA